MNTPKLIANILLVTLGLLVAEANASSQSDGPGFVNTPLPGIEKTQSWQPEVFKNSRYCEVAFFFNFKGRLATEVYNTMGANDCPESKWSKLDPDEMKSRHPEIVRIYLNGPRYWVMDGMDYGSIKDTSGRKVIDFGGIQMSVVTQLKGDDFDKSIYKDVRINRSTTWIYKAGSEIYELINDKGDVYVMQSYSLIVDKNQNIESLRDLGSRLDLPEGWSFKSRILAKDLHLTSKGFAHIIYDNLKNAYQKVE